MIAPFHRRPEDGSVLIVTLIFMAIFGLVTPLMLGQAEANLKNARHVRVLNSKVYAADAGVETAIQRIRSDSSLCVGTAADPSAVTTFPIQVFNSHDVEVRCQRGTGFVVGPLGWAVITTQAPSRDPASLVTQSGTNMKKIDGPVYANGISGVGGGGLQLIVRNGDVYERQDVKTCNTSTAPPAGLTVTPSPPYHYYCTSLARPDPPAALPASVPGPPEKPPALAPGTTDCTVFYPGTYRPGSPGTVEDTKKFWRMNLTQRNYFVSGTYNLENVSIVTEPHNEVWAGRRSPTETTLPELPAPCASPSDDAGTRGTGAKFILGGTAALKSPGLFEIFTRCPPAAAGQDPCDPFLASSEGTRAISIMTVPAGAPSGWSASTVIPKDGEDFKDKIPVLDVGNGSKVVFVAHGRIHVAGYVEAFATNSSIASFQDGILAHSLLLKSSTSSEDGVGVSVRGVQSRRIVITSTAKGASGARDVTATAVVTVQSSTSRPVTIESWRSD